MSEKHQYLPKGLTRAERVDILEREFQHEGDSDQVSFQRAIVYERLTETGLSIQEAAFIEGAIESTLHQKLANDLNELKEQRDSTSQ